MELLIIKSNMDYFRIKEGEYLKCHMDKASVFPLDQIDTVTAHIDALKEKGESEAAICKLTITEEPYYRCSNNK